MYPPTCNPVVIWPVWVKVGLPLVIHATSAAPPVSFRPRPPTGPPPPARGQTIQNPMTPRAMILCTDSLAACFHFPLDFSTSSKLPGTKLFSRRQSSKTGLTVNCSAFRSSPARLCSTTSGRGSRKISRASKPLSINRSPPPARTRRCRQPRMALATSKTTWQTSLTWIRMLASIRRATTTSWQTMKPRSPSSFRPTFKHCRQWRRAMT